MKPAVHGLQLAAVVLLLAAVPSVLVQAAAGAQRPTPPAAAAKPGDPGRSPYAHALAKYRARIDALVAARRGREVSHGEALVRQAQAMDNRLKQRGPQVLEQLRHGADASPTGQLLFDGEVTENEVLVAGSAESAKLFATLLAEKRVAPGDVVSHLMGDEGPLAGEWVPMLQELADARELACWPDAVKVLYRAGISREKYRSLLEGWALEGNQSALETLLFVPDPSTGLQHGGTDVRNRRIFQKLSGPSSPPEIRAVCADWAAETGDLATAEAICTELMWIPYKGRGIRASDPEEPEDSSLYRARVRAMSILYRKVRTDGSFQQIYDRANIMQTEMYEPETLPPGFREFSYNLSARLEIRFAKGLIGEL